MDTHAHERLASAAHDRLHAHRDDEDWLESRWRDPGSMNDLATKAYVNLGEAKPPCAATTPNGDCNGVGRFDILLQASGRCRISRIEIL